MEATRLQHAKQLRQSWGECNPMHDMVLVAHVECGSDACDYL